MTVVCSAIHGSVRTDVLCPMQRKRTKVIRTGARVNGQQDSQFQHQKAYTVGLFWEKHDLSS